MTLLEVQALTYFTAQEKTLSGKKVAWGGYDAGTMKILDDMREQCTQIAQFYKGFKLNPRMILIRGGEEHGPNKLTAVDAVSHMPFPIILTLLMRLPNASWGVYEGGSFHVDRRTYAVFPVRWLAFRDNVARKQWLSEQGLDAAVVSVRDGWRYITWNHPRAWKALEALVNINTPVA